MRIYYFILIFFAAINAFPQDNLEQLSIINNKFAELLNNYNENKALIECEQFENIMNALEYVFVNNNNAINIVIENNLTRIIFSENNILLEIAPRFAAMHLTGSFTYCTGKISLNNQSYEFYLYEHNIYSMNYNEIKDHNSLSFCYFDVSDKNYAYFNIYNTNEYELFIINKYKNIEYFIEIRSSKISTKIIFNKNNWRL